MKIKELTLTNFRRFEQLDLKLPDSNFIILIGENGCGKSSVLDAMAKAINVIPKLFRDSPNFDGWLEDMVFNDDIRNGTDISGISLNTSLFGFQEIINVSKRINDGYTRHTFSDINRLNTLLTEFKDEKIANLPILTYYGLNRTLSTDIINSEIPKITFQGGGGEPLNGYTDAFDSKVSTFSNFEFWFILQENLENEQKIIRQDFRFQITSLEIIRKVVEQFLTEMSAEEFANLRVRRASESNLQFSSQTNQGELVIQKGNKEVKLKQLSSGEKMIFLLVCDIARRLLILNSIDENCLEGEGVVLIDEIEMHLHPKWQRRIVPALRKVFPNIQFIATTHSPQVLSNLSDNEIIVLDDNKYYSPATNPYGRDSNGILEEIFGTTERPPDADKLVDEIFDILSNGQHDMEKAEAKLGDLRGHLGAQDPILLRIENLINRKKILNH